MLLTILRSATLTVSAIAISCSVSFAQDETAADVQETEAAQADTPEAPAAVNVTEVVEDYQIDRRLREILESTDWFESETVEVESGVVFLSGITSDEKYRTWAGDLAAKTEDVVAVVNRIQVSEPPLLDLSPAFKAAKDMLRSSIRVLPLVGLSVGLLLLTWIVGKGVQKVADWTFLKRIETNLVREVSRKAIVIPVFIVGAFLILRVTGLSQLALTVLGGTGLFGLVIGIAFRDIAENFLSSILLSVQNPFRYGDLIEVEGHLGFVQRVNTRGTLLMTFEGNHIQIPNSLVYKGTITNFTSNPNRRFSFTIGIGYDTSSTEAQNAAMKVLAEHPAILSEPEPQVLVEQLASSTINLTVYAWVNAQEHSWGKVKSSVMRLTLRAFEEAGFSMPDDQREIVFPGGVPVQMLEDSEDQERASVKEKKQERTAVAQEDVSNDAEGDFASESTSLNEQARQSRDPDGDAADLLSPASESSNQPEEEPVVP